MAKEIEIAVVVKFKFHDNKKIPPIKRIQDALENAINGVSVALDCLDNDQTMCDSSNAQDYILPSWLTGTQEVAGTHIVVTGNITDGFEVFGPFEDWKTANAHNMDNGEEGIVIELMEPETA